MLICSISASCLARPSVRQLWPRHAGGGCAPGDRWLRLSGRWCLWGAVGFPLRPVAAGVRASCVRPLSVGPSRPPWDPGCMAGPCGLLGRVGTSQTRGWAHWGLRRNWVPAPGQVWRAKWLPQPVLPWGLTAPAGELKGVPSVTWPVGGTLPGSESSFYRWGNGGPGSSRCHCPRWPRRRALHTDAVLSSAGTPSPVSS